VDTATNTNLFYTEIALKKFGYEMD